MTVYRIWEIVSEIDWHILKPQGESGGNKFIEIKYSNAIKTRVFVTNVLVLNI
jgi:hypothetical protein